MSARLIRTLRLFTLTGLLLVLTQVGPASAGPLSGSGDVTIAPDDPCQAEDPGSLPWDLDDVPICRDDASLVERAFWLRSAVEDLDPVGEPRSGPIARLSRWTRSLVPRIGDDDAPDDPGTLTKNRNATVPADGRQARKGTSAPGSSG